MLNEIKELKIHEFKEKLKNQENNKELIIPCQAFNLIFFIKYEPPKNLISEFFIDDIFIKKMFNPSLDYLENKNFWKFKERTIEIINKYLKTFSKNLIDDIEKITVIIKMRS